MTSPNNNHEAAELDLELMGDDGKNEDIAYGVRFPILLLAQHSTVKALIMDSHI